MNKRDFLEKLKSELTGLPESEINERLTFYEEMIDDKIEDGVSENDAVESVGNVTDIANQIISEIPFLKLTKNKLKSKRRLSVLEHILLWGGSPIWFSILISLLAVVFSVYVSGWAVLVSLWATAFSFAVCAVCAPVLTVIFFIIGKSASGIIMLSSGIVLGGLAIFSYFGFKWLTRKYIELTKRLILCLKKSFIGKGEEK